MSWPCEHLHVWPVEKYKTRVSALFTSCNQTWTLQITPYGSHFLRNKPQRHQQIKSGVTSFKEHYASESDAQCSHLTSQWPPCQVIILSKHFNSNHANFRGRKNSSKHRNSRITLMALNCSQYWTSTALCLMTPLNFVARQKYDTTKRRAMSPRQLDTLQVIREDKHNDCRI